MLRKPRVFTRFSRFGRKPCLCFQAPKSHFWRIPSQRADPNAFWKVSRGIRASKTNRKQCVFMRFLHFSSIQTTTRSSLCFSKMLRKPRVFTRFSDRGGYGSVPAFSLFSFARFSKTASETNFGHFSSHAWPPKNDFLASETIRRHFPSLIELCMVRKYLFRGF